MIAISEDEKDYSDYIQVVTNSVNIHALLSGFTFTGITILLSWYPVIGSLAVQIVLFFLASLFFLFMFLLASFSGNLMKFTRNRPLATKDIVSLNHLSILSYHLIQFAVVVMFLVWNLIYLALASGILLALFVFVVVRGYFKAGRAHVETNTG